ncbi:MAG: MFS transporter [Proteobacteria bacterium]|nr:MFS transporter [Pseudomonadota bacterium]MCL2308591.1 MFS transporter [Pseudomonadota bacterium]
MSDQTNGASSIAPAARRRAVIAAVLGNAFEFFDFAIYGMFAVVIAKVFFPAVNEINSIMATVAVFGAAFVLRPIGGILLGMYTDIAGRKKALSLTVILMALGTGMIGLVPPYAAIGIAAPLLIVFARLLQGFSMGGEFSSAVSMLIEYAPKHRRGLYGSWQMSSQGLAFSLGSLSAFLLTQGLSQEALESWGWRIPFLLGILIGPVGFYIRQRVAESPEFVEAMKTRPEQPRSPLTEVLRRFPKEILCGFGLIVVGAAASYVVIIYLPIFGVTQLGLTLGEVQLSTFLACLVLLVLCPIAGYCSDLIGRKSVLFTAITVYALVVYPLFSHFLANPSLAAMILTQCSLAVCMSFFWGPMPATMAELFPVRVRSTGLSLSFNLGGALFGGLAPLYLTYLLRETGNPMVPAYYLLMSTAFGLAATWALDFNKARAAQASWQAG